MELIKLAAAAILIKSGSITEIEKLAASFEALSKILRKFRAQGGNLFRTMDDYKKYMLDMSEGRGGLTRGFYTRNPYRTDLIRPNIFVERFNKNNPKPERSDYFLNPFISRHPVDNTTKQYFNVPHSPTNTFLHEYGHALADAGVANKMQQPSNMFNERTKNFIPKESFSWGRRERAEKTFNPFPEKTNELLSTLKNEAMANHRALSLLSKYENPELLGQSIAEYKKNLRPAFKTYEAALLNSSSLPERAKIIADIRSLVGDWAGRKTPVDKLQSYIGRHIVGGYGSAAANKDLERQFWRLLQYKKEHGRVPFSLLEKIAPAYYWLDTDRQLSIPV